jgi:hypothetical protein
MDDAPEQKSDPNGRLLVEATLKRHGVSDSLWAETLEQVLDLTPSKVRRRLSGETPWSIEEVLRLAAHFGEPAHRPFLDLDSSRKSAVLTLNGRSVPCWIWTSASPDVFQADRFAALPGAAGQPWTVLQVQKSGQEAFGIEHLVIARDPGPRVAVLARNHTQLVDFLCLKGLDAFGYSTVKALKAELTARRFEGFILESNSLGQASSALLAEIRADSPIDAPLVLVCPPPDPGSAEEAQMTALGDEHLAILIMEPTSPLTLLSLIQSRLRR